MTLSNLIAGVAGLHRLGAAGGLIVAALAIPFAWGAHWLGGFPLVAIGTLIGCAKIIYAAPRASVPMIGDRAVGMWLALWPLSGGLWFAGVAPHIFPWPGWVGAFFAFRLFDIWKPWLVGRAERLHGATGVMLDDIVAGVFAAIAVSVAAAIAHGVLMA